MMQGIKVLEVVKFADSSIEIQDLLRFVFSAQHISKKRNIIIMIDKDNLITGLLLKSKSDFLVPSALQMYLLL